MLVKWDAVTGSTDTVAYTEWNLMRDRVKDYVTVGFSDSCDYVCDGAADDVQLQAAISYAVANHKTVLCKAGTYDITATVQVEGHLTLRGEGTDAGTDGVGTKFKSHAGLNDYIITINHAQGVGSYWRVKFEHLKFNGSDSTSTGGGVQAYGIVESTFLNCHFENCYDYGLHFWGTQGNGGNYGHNNRVIACLFDSMSSGGLATGLRMKANDENEVTCCEFQYCKIGISDEAGFGQYTTSSFVSCTNGMYLLDCSRSKVVGCVFDKCTHEGVFLKGAFNNIVGCTFYDNSSGNANGYAALKIDWYGCNVISGNTFASDVAGECKYAILENGATVINNNTTGNNIITGNQAVSMGGATVLGANVWGTAVISESGFNANHKSNNYYMNSAGNGAF